MNTKTDEAAAVSIPNERTLMGKLTRVPGFAIYLIPSGFLAGVTYLRFGGSRTAVMIIPFVLGTLVIIRFSANVLRRISPVSRVTRNSWAHARLVSKRFDSHQWQKLLWVGLGIGVAGLFERSLSVQYVLFTTAAVCVTSGAVAAMVWRRTYRKNRELIDSWME